MAKKKKKSSTRKEAAAKKPASAAVVKKKAPAKKKTPAQKKAPAKKKVAKKTAKKTTKKAAAKSPPAETSPEANGQTPAASKPTPKPKGKKRSAKKQTTPPSAKGDDNATAKPATSENGANAADDGKNDADGKGGRKGITIVRDRPKRRPKAPPASTRFPPPGQRLLGPGAPKRKPLIPSGPRPDARDADADADAKKGRRKQRFPKKKMDAFRDRLLTKRAQLLGELNDMEQSALRSGGSGSLSNTPQHIAEQGSDSYDQSLALNLAAADRALIREIDAALGRIEDKSYGYCERTGEPISEARLEELPWTRLSVKAAQELERGRR